MNVKRLLENRFNREAPPVVPVKSEPKVLIAPAKDRDAPDKPKGKLVTRPGEGTLKAGGSQKSGRSKDASREVAGMIRGGRHSPRWGEPVKADGWFGAALPPEARQKLTDLAGGHKLYQWQVIVEALDLFEAKHGKAHGGKKSAN